MTSLCNNERQKEHWRTEELQVQKLSTTQGCGQRPLSWPPAPEAKLEKLLGRPQLCIVHGIKEQNAGETVGNWRTILYGMDLISSSSTRKSYSRGRVLLVTLGAAPNCRHGSTRGHLYLQEDTDLESKHQCIQRWNYSFLALEHLPDEAGHKSMPDRNWETINVDQPQLLNCG